MPMSNRPVQIGVCNMLPHYHTFISLETTEEAPYTSHVTPSPNPQFAPANDDLTRLILAYHAKHGRKIAQYALAAMGVDAYMDSVGCNPNQESWFSTHGRLCLSVSLRPSDSTASGLHNKLKFFAVEVQNTDNLEPANQAAILNILRPRYPCIAIAYHIETPETANSSSGVIHNILIRTHQFVFPTPDTNRPEDKWHRVRVSHRQLARSLAVDERMLLAGER